MPNPVLTTPPGRAADHAPPPAAAPRGSEGALTYIGDEIARERKAARLTSKRVAGITGLSPQFIGDVQHGRRIPSLETAWLIAQAFPDADRGRWAWLVIRDLYGDAMFDELWSYAVKSGVK